MKKPKHLLKKRKFRDDCQDANLSHALPFYKSAPEKLAVISSFGYILQRRIRTRL